MDDIEARAVLAFASQAARELKRLDAGIWRERLEGRYQEVEPHSNGFLIIAPVTRWQWPACSPNSCGSAAAQPSAARGWTERCRMAGELQEARGFMTQRDEWAIPYTLNGLAAIAVETGAFEPAATLLAADATLQDQQHGRRTNGRTSNAAVPPSPRALITNSWSGHGPRVSACHWQMPCSTLSLRLGRTSHSGKAR
jgi:hypothetical protein